MTPENQKLSQVIFSVQNIKYAALEQLATGTSGGTLIHLFAFSEWVPTFASDMPWNSLALQPFLFMVRTVQPTGCSTAVFSQSHRMNVAVRPEEKCMDCLTGFLCVTEATGSNWMFTPEGTQMYLPQLERQFAPDGKVASDEKGMVLSGRIYTAERWLSLSFLPFQSPSSHSLACRQIYANKYKAYGSVGALPSLDLLGLGVSCAFLEHSYVCSSLERMCPI